VEKTSDGTSVCQERSVIIMNFELPIQAWSEATGKRSCRVVEVRGINAMPEGHPFLLPSVMNVLQLEDEVARFYCFTSNTIHLATRV
jgi:hypothetical protein